MERPFEPFTLSKADSSDALRVVKPSPRGELSKPLVSLGDTLEAAARAEGGPRFSLSLPVRG